MRDLGVEMSEDLTTFTRHNDNISIACRKMTGWILRSYKTRSRDTMLTLWKSLIQSKLDYCSQLWSPNNAKDINRLEDLEDDLPLI